MATADAKVQYKAARANMEELRGKVLSMPECFGWQGLARRCNIGKTA